MIDFGVSFMWSASSLVMMRFLSIVMPGTLRADEPVATMISFAVSFCAGWPSLVTSIWPLPSSFALPFTHSTLFFLKSMPMPSVRPLTILSLRACTALRSMPMGPSGRVMPQTSLACCMTL